MYETLDQFPQEILYDIFNSHEPETLLTLRKVNKTLNVVATDVLFRQKNAQALAYQKAFLAKNSTYPNFTDVSIVSALLLTAIQNPDIPVAVRLKALIYCASRNKIELIIKEETIDVLTVVSQPQTKLVEECRQ